MAKIDQKEITGEEEKVKKKHLTETTHGFKEKSEFIVKNGIDYIPGIEYKVAFLPMGPTQDQIDKLVELGKIKSEEIYIGDDYSKITKQPINVKGNSHKTFGYVSIPQVFGYVIKDNEELEKIITDKDTIAEIKKNVNEGGVYPTIFLLNYPARVEYVKYLGGRMPSLKELEKIWKAIPGDNNMEKAAYAGIPFTGGFDMYNKKFYNTGDDFTLGSSLKGEQGGHSTGLRFHPSGTYVSPRSMNKEGYEGIGDKNGVSTLVIFSDQNPIDKEPYYPEIIIREPIVPEHQKGFFKQGVNIHDYSEVKKGKSILIQNFGHNSPLWGKKDGKQYMILNYNEVGFTVEEYAESIMDFRKYDEIYNFIYPDDFTCERIDIIDKISLEKIKELGGEKISSMSIEELNNII